MNYTDFYKKNIPKEKWDFDFLNWVELVEKKVFYELEQFIIELHSDYDLYENFKKGVTHSDMADEIVKSNTICFD